MDKMDNVFRTSLLAVMLIPLVLLAVPEKKSPPIPMVIQARCEMCAEPFFVPTFRFQVVAGTWPGKGVIRCRMDSTPVMKCENGLELSVAGIVFSSGGEQ